MLAALEKKKVVVMDAQPVVRDGLRAWINAQKDMLVTGAAADTRTLFSLLAHGEPDALVMGLSLGETTGVEVLNTIRARGYRFPIVVYTLHAEALYARSAFEAGAQGYLTKTAGSAELIPALRRVLAGQTAFSANALALLRDTGDAQELATLSPQERDVFVLMGQRRGNQEIAQQLGVSPSTISNVKERIKKKFGLASTKDLDAKAILYTHGARRDSARRRRPTAI